ncbi:hypothetical protein ElyMa_006174700 [Elysia marginata]|uniref:Uncharacterized protein n=1 Tax=Elysia marginata TaxID=1093978 RepID=A0AAV4H3M1_9GAST|nr:hypothetical protein ElyMa_006174700 [Elysia marginata]
MLVFKRAAKDLGSIQMRNQHCFGQGKIVFRSGFKSVLPHRDNKTWWQGGKHGGKTKPGGKVVKKLVAKNLLVRTKPGGKTKPHARTKPGDQTKLGGKTNLAAKQTWRQDKPGGQKKNLVARQSLLA